MKLLSSSCSRLRNNWAWYLIPINAGNSGIGTVVSLYMLQMGGTVKDVALSAFISGLAITIGSLFWGKIIDTMHLRRTIIVISSAPMAVLAALINLVSTIESLILISVILGSLTSGTGSVLNLLVREKSIREEWIKTINWTSMFSCTGIVMAMMMGFLWLHEHNVKS